MNIDTDQTQRVAVYGTLKRGYQANAMLSPGKFIGAGVSEERFYMMDTGWYPMLLEIDGSRRGSKVAVEVYEVPADLLQGRLDSYEGVPSLYTRKKVQVTLHDGTVTEAWIYVGRDPYDYHVYDIMYGSKGVVAWPDNCPQREDA